MTNHTEKNIPMVPKFQAEKESFHQTRMNRNMMIVICAAIAGFCIFAICMVYQAQVFVNGYTSRTKDWLNTLAQLQNSATITEVTDGYEADP